MFSFTSKMSFIYGLSKHCQLEPTFLLGVKSVLIVPSLFYVTNLLKRVDLLYNLVIEFLLMELNFECCSMISLFLMIEGKMVISPFLHHLKPVRSSPGSICIS